MVSYWFPIGFLMFPVDFQLKQHSNSRDLWDLTSCPHLSRCTMLHHVAPCCTMLRCTMLHHVAPCCTMLHHVAPCCTMLHLSDRTTSNNFPGILASLGLTDEAWDLWSDLRGNLIAPWDPCRSGSFQLRWEFPRKGMNNSGRQ